MLRSTPSVPVFGPQAYLLVFVQENPVAADVSGGVFTSGGAVGAARFYVPFIMPVFEMEQT